MLIFILISLFLLFPSFTFTQVDKIYFEHISIDKNLSHYSIAAIAQDRTGFLWVGSRLGLNLFDGYNFKIFRVGSTDSTLSNDIARSIYEDKEGYLWIGTINGLNRYNSVRGSFTRFFYKKDSPNSICNNQINCIIEDKLGDIWIGTESGLSRYNKKLNKFFNYFQENNKSSIRSNKIKSLHMDKNGNIWIGTNKLGLNLVTFKECKRTNENNSAINLNHIFLSSLDKKPDSLSYITQIHQDKFNNLWIGTNSNGLLFFQTNENILNSITPHNHIYIKSVNYLYNNRNRLGISNNFVSGICEDKSGNLWIATFGGGLNLMNSKRTGFTVFKYDPRNSKSISNDYIQSIVEDRSGNIWIGTFAGGLNKYSPNRSRFDIYQSNPYDPGSIKSNFITAIYKDKEGILWLGTRDGLNRLDRKNNRCESFQNNNTSSIYNNNLIRSICEDKNSNLWIGTHNGINLFNKKNNTFISINHKLKNILNRTTVRTLLSENNSIWIGSSKNLIRYNLEKEIITEFFHDPLDSTSLSSHYVWSSYKDQFGDLWFGTSNGLNKFNKQTNSFKRFIFPTEKNMHDKENLITSISEDNSGNLWFGTYGGGIHYLSQYHNVFSSQDRMDSIKPIHFEIFGFKEENINGILIDSSNFLWVGSDKGIININSRRDNWRIYNIKDNISISELNVGAIFKDDKGEFFFGGNNGMISFFPNKMKINENIPNIALTSLKIFDNEIYSGTQASHLKEVNLSYKDNIITFSFAALDFTQPMNNQYAYRLKGYNDNWITCGNRTEVSYMNLGGGDYIFEVIGSNNDGRWNKIGYSLKVTITPPIWETLWFRALLVLTISSLVFSFLRYRIRRIERQKLLLEKQVELRTEDLNRSKIQLEEENRIRKKVNEEMIKTNELLRESNATKNKLFSIISHDLKGPIGNLVSTLKIFDSGEEMDQTLRKEFIQGMIDSAESTFVMLENLLSWSRAQSDSIHLIFENTSLAELTEETIHFLNEMASKKIISIKSNIDDNIIAYCDANTIATVIRNLISNAIKFTQVNGSVEISATEKNGTIIYMVKDSGIGIKPALLKSMLENINIVSTKGTSGEKGTGLGLLLCMDFIRKNNGHLWAESEAGKGTTFYFSLEKAKSSAQLIA